MSTDNKIKTGVLISIIVAGIIAGVGFGFNNASLPKQEKQINATREDINEIKNYLNADRVEKEGMKRDIKFTQQTLNEFREDVKEGLKIMQQELREINRNTK